ncbi:MAG: 4a-hydroxytetrahydrobiopterin dehydratase [Ignavibacteria bacterium]|nr:MAG: 4a-hydroxytetrahydrobiopterin dehydratase [Ignavibacteria bacterium]
MKAMNDQEIQTRLQVLAGWKLEGGQIRNVYELPTFHRAIGFVVEIGMIADVADHHPDIDIRYNRVTIALSTHDADGITEKDFSLAASIDGLLS